MLSRTKRELRATEDKITEVAAAAKSIIEDAAKEGRSRTDDENAEVAAHTKTLETLKDNKRELEDQLAMEQSVQDSVGAPEHEAKGLELPNGFGSVSVGRTMTIGEQFTESASYKTLFGSGKGPTGDWRTGPINLETKSTVTSGGTLGAFGNYTQFVPGVVETLFQVPTVADLLPSATATSPQITYNQELTTTNAAAATAESGLKPESAFTFDEVTEPVKKLATFLPVSDEMLEDAPQVQAYLNQRLSLFIRIAEETSILRGSGTNDLVGFVNSFTARGIGSAVVTGTAASNAGTAIYGDLFDILNNQRGSSHLEPDAIIMHPNEWGTIRTRYDTAGQYYGGGPILGPYGGPQGPAQSSQLSQSYSLWGVQVHVTSAIGAGTMLVGAFRQGAQLFRRGGITVEASNSHSDFFQRNQTAIRAEERLALAVYRPSAFTVVTWA